MLSIRSFSGGGYPNFMMDDEGETRLKATYGNNYERLSQLKKKYDPGNVLPAASGQ